MYANLSKEEALQNLELDVKDNLDLNQNEKMVTIVSLQLMRLSDLREVFEHFHQFKLEYEVNPDILSMYLYFVKSTATQEIFTHVDVQDSFKSFTLELNKHIVSDNQPFEAKHMSVLLSMIIHLHSNDILRLDILTMENVLLWLNLNMHSMEYKHIPMMGIFIVQCRDCDN